MLPERIEDWPSEWREAYEERAAIMEYEGGLERIEAERKAEHSTRNSEARIEPEPGQ